MTAGHRASTLPQSEKGTGVLFISRGWTGPSPGGLERYARELVEGYPGRSAAIVMPGGRANLVWFIPVAVVRAVLTIRGFDRVHGTDAISGMLAAVVGFLGRRPWSFTAHGLDVIWPWRPYQVAVRRLLRAAALVVVNSEATGRACIERGARPEAVRVIPPGIGADQILASESERQTAAARLPVALEDWVGRRFLVVTLGRLVQRKGVDWFVRSVMPELPPDVAYLVAGEGPEYATVLKSIAERDLSDRVRLLGRVSDATALSLLARADLMVMPNIETSGDMEGFGIVALEAGAAGTPVMAANTEGIRDALATRAGALRVAPQDTGAWVAAIERVQRLGADCDPELIVEEIGAYLWPSIAARYREAFADASLTS